MTLPGLRSRCTTPRAWAKSTAWHTLAKAESSLWRVKSFTASGSPAPRASMISSKVLPWTRFIVK
jgi:hypothetical protein